MLINKYFWEPISYDYFIKLMIFFVDYTTKLKLCNLGNALNSKLKSFN